MDPIFREYWMSPGASSSLGQNFALFLLEGEPALVIGPQQVGNAADLWVREVHISGNTGMDDSVPPVALPGEAERLYDVLHGQQPVATPTAALLSLLLRT